MIKNYLNEKHDIEIIDKYIKSSPKFKKNSLSLNNIWRGKNINEMIHTSIDFDYLNLFKKNYKSMGKIKFIK